MRDLLELLDRELGSLEALVRCTQREQQHLLAFEPEALGIVLEEKRRLLTAQEGLRRAREDAVSHALRALSPSAPAHPDRDAGTLTDLIEALPRKGAREVALRRDRLRAILGALAELNATTGFHAERHLRFVRDCRRKLGAGPGAGRGEVYDPSGRAQRSLGAGLRLSGCV